MLPVFLFCSFGMTSSFCLAVSESSSWLRVFGWTIFVLEPVVP